MGCQTGINNAVTKYLEDKKGYLSFNGRDFIEVKTSYKEKVNPSNYYNVAEGVAKSLNKAINTDIKLGPVFYAKRYSDGIGVLIKPNEHQLALLNAKDEREKDEALAELEKVMPEKDRLDLENDTSFGLNDEGDSMPQKAGVPSETSIASPKTIALFKEFLTRAGIDVKQVKEIYADGIKQNDAGIARLTKALIEVIEGAEYRSLPEEGMHFYVAIIKQTNPELYKQLLNEINGYNMYQKVIDDYGMDPRYQKDGKPNILKLKEEAIAKVLVEKIIRGNEETTEKPENLAKAEKWWEKILNWIKGLFVKAGFDKATMDFMTGKDIGTAADIKEEVGAEFAQKGTGDPQKDTVARIKEEESKMTPPDNEKNTPYRYAGKDVGLRTSDLTHELYDDIFRGKGKEEDQEWRDAVNSIYAETGTGFHADIHNMLQNVFLDKDGYVREKEGDDSDYVSQMPENNREAYDLIKGNIRERLKSLNEDGKTIFLSETMVIDPRYGKSGLAGTIDFIAIKSNGKVSLLDWKFMGLNTDKYTDVPWYKILAWNNQMDLYKRILEKHYGIRPDMFEQTMMIPVRVEYSKAIKSKGILPALLRIEIGSVDIKSIDKDYLIPVGTKTQTSGYERIDTLLKALNADYKAMAEKPALTYEQKAEKAEQLNAAFSAIRKLQMQQDIKPLLKQADILLYYTRKVIDKYKNEWEGKDPFTFSDEALSDYSNDLREHRIALTSYLTLNTALRELFKDNLTEADKALRSKLRETVEDATYMMEDLKDITKNFGSNFLAKREGFDDLLKADKVIRGFSWLFNSTALQQSGGIQTFFKKENRALALAAQETFDQAEFLKGLEKEYVPFAQSKGLTRKNLFEPIKKKGKNELIDEYSPEFFKQLKEKIEEGDIAWVQSNVDVEATKALLAEKRDKEIDYLKNRAAANGTSDEELLRLIEAKNREWSSENNGAGWLHYYQVKQFPIRDKWESPEFKKLNSPGYEPAKRLYEYIRDRNNYYTTIGYLSKEDAARTFLPWMPAGIMEIVASGGDLKMADSFLSHIALDREDVGFANYDPRTGEPIDRIPIYFTKELDKGVQASEDIFKNMALYNAMAIRFKYMQTVEGQALLLLDIERNKESINTSIFGTSRFTKEGKLDIVNDNSKNSQLLENMIKAVVYNQKYLKDANFDAMIGSFGEWGQRVNKTLGVNIFPEGQVSLMKSIDALNNYFRAKTLGFSILSPMSNYLGGNFQSMINAERYFTRADHMKSQMIVAGKLFGLNFADREKFIKALDYFLPLSENYSRKVARELSLNKLDGDKINHFMLGLMTSSERSVQVTNFMSFMRNTILENGVVYNTREYVRSLPEFKNMFIGSQSEQLAKRKAFEAKVNELNDEKGILKLGQIVDNRFVIPGVERTSDNIITIRTRIQQVNTDALGALPESQKRMLNAMLLTDSAAMFKGWIPRMVDVRFGALKYNAASDAWEFGRMRTFANEVTKKTFYSLGNLKALLSGTVSEEGFNRMREDYEKKKEKYEKETGKTFKMTEEEYMNLYNKNLRGSIFDVIASLTFLSIFLGLKANEPDKDDVDAEIRNSYKFMLRAADKFRDELTYFYDPSSISGLISTGVFPTFKLITDFEKLLANFMKYNWGLIQGKSSEDLKDIHFVKYLMNEFPGTNQIQTYLPMALPDVAKAMGIQAQSQSGFSR